MELKERLLEAALLAFNEKGTKFTLQDISKALSISKKTIYTVFPDKEALLEELVDQGFRNIKIDEQAILEDPTLSIRQKIERIIIVLPDSIKKTDFKKFSLVKEKYPKLFKRIQHHIETGWEPTIALIEEGMAQGQIRKIPIPVLKAMIEASIEHFLESEDLYQAGLDYDGALLAMMDIIMNGI